MIAVVCSWHDCHEEALREIQERLSRKQRMVVAAHTLIEAYSVLTRLPAPHRISPKDALNLLEGNFMRPLKIIVLTAAGHKVLLRGAPDANISGGRVYDALIAACARKAKVQSLITFNELHFAAFEGSDLEIVVPRRKISKPEEG